jgi:multidrug efflux pump subunit AcrB
VDEKLNVWRDRTTEFVAAFVRWRYVGFGGLIGILMVCVSLLTSGILGFSPLPELDNESIEAKILLAPGAPFERAQARVQTLLEALEQVNDELTPLQPDQQSMVRQVVVHYGRNADAHESGDHAATIVVDLLSPEIRTHTSTEIRSLWRNAVGILPDVAFLKFSDPQIGPSGKPLELRLLGSDLAELYDAAVDLQRWLAVYEGVHDLSMDLRPGRPELRYQLKPGAQELGINSAIVAEQLRGAFNGLIVQEVQVGREKYEVQVRLDAASRTRFNTLDTFMIQSAAGHQVPLSAVAYVVESRGYARLNRVNGESAITLEGLIDASRTTSAAVLSHTQREFLPQWLENHPEVRLDIRGETERSSETLGSMRQGFLLGFLGMFMLLALQFRSYVEPLVVIVIIPLSFIGVVIGHLLMGYNLTMPSILGFISLAGIVVNDSILLVTFVEKRLAQGMALADAVVQAARDRFRAILLTSVTTVVGLLPLLLETSLQAKVVIPLAISLAFGLTTATMMVIFVIPAFYMILHDLGLFHRHEELTATATV